MEDGPIRLIAVSVVALLLTAAAPVAFASSITVTLNPTTKVARFDSVSTTNIVLTYPANSSLSGYLRGYNSSLSLSGDFRGDSSSMRSFQRGMD